MPPDDDVSGRSERSFPPPPHPRFVRLLLIVVLFSLVSLPSTPSRASPFESDAETPEALFTDDFVIQVPGGEAMARRIAEEHGLVFEGRVHEDLGDFYVVRRLTNDEVEEERMMKGKRKMKEPEEEEGNVRSVRRKRSAEDHLFRLRRDERLTYVQRERLLQREKRGYLPLHLLIDEDDEEATEEVAKEEKEGPAKMRNKWKDFEREAFEFEKRRPSEYYRVRATNDEEKRGENDDDDKSCPNHNDAMWKDQWYLCNRGQTGGKLNFDLNVAPAWASGITGKGVVVCVMDDGVDHTHKDLMKNFDFEASWDANGKRNLTTDDPEPRREDSSNDHGTKCAGEIAMQADNGICGVGVAPDSKVGGIRILDGPITDRLEAKAILFKNDYIDIYSASWGPKDNGETMEAPGKLTSAALVQAVTKGRKGLGSLFVWASGNGGSRGDDCGADGYVSSIYTISIGSINENGLSTYFMEKCPSTMAVVFSGGMHDRSDWRFDDGRPRIKTVSTDIYQGCVENFQGTSAAAPLATGCVALMLQANPKLGWRDAQHIVVHSARIPNADETAGWEINGAGHHINDKFGFGVLDCSKMVQLARNWTNVPPQKICVTHEEKPRLTIPAGKSVRAFLTTDACRDDPEHRVDVLEHVQVGIQIKHPRRGDLVLRLYSPDGTMSELLSRRSKDKHADIKFVFMTVRKWGEKPGGKWALEVDNKGDKDALLEKFVLELHGYQTQKETRDAEGVAEQASPKEINAIFERELEASERIQLKRVALVLAKFSEEDRRAVLSAMSPTKKRFVEEALRKRENGEAEEEEEREEETKREMGMKEELDTLQGLVDMIEKSLTDEEK